MIRRMETKNVNVAPPLVKPQLFRPSKYTQKGPSAKLNPFMDNYIDRSIVTSRVTEIIIIIVGQRFVEEETIDGRIL
jgi:uncharacterized protein YukJ